MGKLSKDELKVFKQQEEKKQAILHDLGLLATQSHTLSHMFAELSLKQEQSKKGTKHPILPFSSALIFN